MSTDFYHWITDGNNVCGHDFPVMGGKKLGNFTTIVKHLRFMKRSVPCPFSFDTHIEVEQIMPC